MRRRLVLAVAGVSSVALVLFAVPLALVLQRSYEDEEMLKLQRDVVAATRQVDLPAKPGDRIELATGFDSIAAYSRSSRLVAGRAPSGAASLASEAVRSGRIVQQQSQGMLMAAVPVLLNERVTGAVLGTRDDSTVDSRTAHAWLAIGGFAALIAILAVLAAVLLARRLARPLEDLAVAATRLGDGDFSARTTRSGVPETNAVAEALNATGARLDEMVRREREFSANASHQLRTPLAALRLELESAALDGAPEGATGRALDEVDRLERTVTALLAAARDDPRQAGPADLEATLRDVERRWRGPLAERGRPLRIMRDPSVRDVAISPTVLDEILSVLLDNAVTHGGGEVTVSARRAGDAVMIEVGDEGAGFRDPEASFNRRSATAEGHGVGLSLARSLAQAEGGDLRLSRASPRPVLSLLLRASDGAGATVGQP